MSNTSDTSSVLETARRAAADAGLDPASLAHDVSARLREAAEAQKNAGAEKVMGVARAIRSAAGSMEDDSPEVARYVRSAASTLEGITQDINERSVDEMTQAVVDVARRSPGLFFAGSVLAGFALFRFLNSAQNGAGPSGYRPSPRNARGAQHMGGQSTGAGKNPSQTSGKGGYGSSDAGGYDAGSSSTHGSMGGSSAKPVASGTTDTRGAS